MHQWHMSGIYWGHIAVEVFLIRDCENTVVKYMEHYEL